MSSKDRGKSSLTSSPSLKSKKASPNVNRKSMKLDVPKSFTIDVNQIAVARKQLKNVGKGHTAEELSSITLEAPEKQGNLLIMMPEATTWAQLWCVLKEGRLYIFSNSKATVPDKILSMQGSKVSDKKLPGVEYCFQINTRSGETLLFRTDEDFEYVTWIVSLRGATLYLKISSFVIDTPRREANTSLQSVTSAPLPTSSSSLPSTTSPVPSLPSVPPPAISPLPAATSLPSTPPPAASIPTSPLSPTTKPASITSPSPVSPTSPPPTASSLPPTSSLPPLSPVPPTSPLPSNPAPTSPTSATSPTSLNFQNTSPVTRKVTQALVQKNPNFVPSSPILQEKSPYRNSTGVSALPSEIPRFSPDIRNYRKSADISKLTRSMDLSDVVSAAYRKSADLSKTASPQLPHSSLSHSNNSLFSSVEIVDSAEQEDGVKTKRGLLGVPAGGLFNKWKQRWVVLANESLSVYKQEEDEEKQGKEPMHSFEIIFCQPKVVQSEKGKFVFEIHAPGRTIQFNAPSSVVLLEWITTIQETQTSLMQSYLQYNLNGSDKKGEEGESENKQQLELELEKSKKKLADIMKLPGNNQCADCGCPDPLWATINFGVFICIECSGVHRQMGTHISKVRSITMDKWDADVLEFMENRGNVKVNAELEHNILPQYSKLTPSSSRQERDAFIKAKYDEKLFAEKQQ